MKNIKYDALLVWFISGLFSCYQFCAQVMAGPMTIEIMQAYKLDAISVSYTISSFFYIYLLMQLPAGIILDRYPSRYLLPLTCFICAIGTLLMGISNDVYSFTISRMICAFGASFGFIGSMRILRNYFPMQYIPLFIGLTETQGFIATFLCASTVSYYLPILGFKAVLFNFGIIGIALSFVVYISLLPKVAPKKEYASLYKHDNKSGENNLNAKDIIDLLKNKKIWLLGLISFGFFSLVTSFAALWGVPSLMNIHNLSLNESAKVISCIFLGIAFGGPIIGHFSKTPEKQQATIFWCSLFCAILLFVVIKVPNLNFVLLCFLMFLSGTFSCCYLLCFSIGNGLVDSKLSGTCMGFINMITMASALILQPLMGYLVSWYGIIGMTNGTPIYTVNGYKAACLSLVAIFLCVSILSKINFNKSQ